MNKLISEIDTMMAMKLLDQLQYNLDKQYIEGYIAACKYIKELARIYGQK